MCSKPDAFKPHNVIHFVIYLVTPHDREHTPVPRLSS